MELFIEGRNGLRYELKPLNRKEKIEMHDLTKNSEAMEGFDKIHLMFYKLLKFSYPNMSKEEFEDVLDYNAEMYGFEETYEMIGYLIEDVFTLTGGQVKSLNPYLMKKREQKALQENN